MTRSEVVRRMLSYAGRGMTPREWNQAMKTEPAIPVPGTNAATCHRCGTTGPAGGVEQGRTLLTAKHSGCPHPSDKVTLSTDR